jgi:uncharacterized protein YkwD
MWNIHFYVLAICMILWYGMFMKLRSKLVNWTAIALVISFFISLGVAAGYNATRDENKPVVASQPIKQPITPDGLYIAINEARVANGLAPFTRNATLDKTAQLKCDDMVKGNYYDHKNPSTGKIGYDFIKDVGQSYNNASENLNEGPFNNPKEVIDSWMGSEAHRASIVDPQFKEIGFATCVIPLYPDQTTIVQHKIAPYVAPAVTPQVQQQPVRQLNRSTTNCTYHDYNGVFDPTVNCSTY